MVPRSPSRQVIDAGTDGGEDVAEGADILQDAARVGDEGMAGEGRRRRETEERRGREAGKESFGSFLQKRTSLFLSRYELFLKVRHNFACEEID